MPADEPTLADVLSQLTDLNTQVVNLRADVATFRLDTITRLTTLFDEVAAFRGEYNTHTHEAPPPPSA